MTEFAPWGRKEAWRSTVLMLREGGIRWRNTCHPLAALRAGRVR